MPCYHPLPAIRKRGEKTFRVGRENEVFHPYTDFSTGERVEPISIPCGQCIGCRLDYSRAWADRCVLEASLYEHNYFLTLTYDDDHIVTRDRSLITEKNTLSLYPKDLQDFMKRLRERWERVHNHTGIRFYACGEYGSESLRPHYHVIAFNLPLFDKQLYATTEAGNALFTSDELEDVWGNGFAPIGEVNWETCAYTARYVMKKQKGKGAAEYYKQVGIFPEFVRMSRDPGIGRPYFDAHKEEIYRSFDVGNRKLAQGSLVLPGGREVNSPKYFDRLYAQEDEVFMAFLKETRQRNAELNKKNVLAHTDLDERGYFEVQEKNKKDSIKALTRLL